MLSMGASTTPHLQIVAPGIPAEPDLIFQQKLEKKKNVDFNETSPDF